MRAIDAITGRLDHAAGVPDLLAAAWEAFEFIRAAASGCADPGAGLYAAFMFAASAAAEARDTVGLAPSMPAGDLAPGGDQALEEAAGPLAELAGALAARMAATAVQAEDPGDREAFRAAAAGAGQVRRLLAGGG